MIERYVAVFHESLNRYFASKFVAVELSFFHRKGCLSRSRKSPETSHFPQVHQPLIPIKRLTAQTRADTTCNEICVDFRIGNDPIDGKPLSCGEKGLNNSVIQRRLVRAFAECQRRRLHGLFSWRSFPRHGWSGR